MNDLLSIIYQPFTEFKAVKENQVNWFYILLVLMLLTIIQIVLFFPIQAQLMAHSDMFSKMPAEQAAIARSVAEKMKYVGIISACFVYVIKLLLQGLMVWGGVALFKGKISFLQSIILVGLASFVTLIGDFVNVAILFQNGVENITSLADVSKTGLNLFFDPKVTGLPLFTLLSYINPFQIWNIILIIFGINLISDLPLSKATILCLILWLLWVSVPVIGVVFSELAQSKAGMV